MTCEGQNYSFTTSCKVDAQLSYPYRVSLVRQRTTPPITEGDSHTSHRQTESLVTHCDFSAGISET